MPKQGGGYEDRDQASWTQSCAACCRWPCFSSRVGLDDPQRSLPSPNILWFCEKSCECVNNITINTSVCYFPRNAIALQSCIHLFKYRRNSGRNPRTNSRLQAPVELWFLISPPWLPQCSVPFLRANLTWMKFRSGAVMLSVERAASCLRAVWLNSTSCSL